MAKPSYNTLSIRFEDEQSAQNSDSKTLSSAAGVSFQAAQSGKQKQPKISQVSTLLC